MRGSCFMDHRGSISCLWDNSIQERLCQQFAPHSFLLSKNPDRHTLRGLHFQYPPNEQTKLVTCIRGKAHDVILDLRPDSPTFRQWQAFLLNSQTPETLFIPAGCAHGYLTLEPETWMSYFIQGQYVPESGGIIRWNDPFFGMKWPVKAPLLSQKDLLAPDYQP